MIPSTPPRIWIDFDNTPHVLFFRPIIPELEKRGYTVIVTARDAYQVTEVAEMYNIECKKIGRHYGKNKLMKVIGTFIRALQLMWTVLCDRPVLAVSHGSRSQIVASKLLLIKSLAIFDYEHAAIFFFTTPTWGLSPEVVAKSTDLKKWGRHLYSYPGIKENVYVPFFRPEMDIRKELDIPENKILVLVRPPATEAHYHNHQADLILDTLIPFIDKNNALAFVVPRNHRQQKNIEQKFNDIVNRGSLIIPKKAYDGLVMIWFSDLVVSGGGTMNREAAALDVPVYSIFRGKTGAVDRHLSSTGKLIMIEKPEDVETKIRLEKRKQSSSHLSDNMATFNAVIDRIEKLANGTK